MALSTISGTTGITDATITSAKLADFTAAVDLNGVELLLDADADTSISADTDDRIDFKIANTDHFSLSSSSGDTVFKPLTDAKDLIFQQFDGNKVLEINDSGFVGIGGNSNAAGEIRIFEDTDDGNNYVGLKVGNVSTAYTLVFPNADGSNGQAMVTNGSGVLSFTDVTANVALDDVQTGDAAVTLATSAGNITIDAQGNDTDIIFKGTDGSADTTFLTLDGSAAGAASFNGAITANAGVVIDNITIDGTEIDLSSGDLTLDVAGDIVLDADGADVIFKDDGTEYGRVTNSSTDFVIQTAVSDKDFILKGNDDGSTITALTVDMSAAGAATFNNDVTAFSDVILKDNIDTIDNALDRVKGMRGVFFDRKDNKQQRQTGVIAQEVEPFLPEVVRETKDEKKIKSVAYGNMVGVLIEAIKELNAKIEELQHGNKE